MFVTACSRAEDSLPTLPLALGVAMLELRKALVFQASTSSFTSASASFIPPITQTFSFLLARLPEQSSFARL